MSIKQLTESQTLKYVLSLNFEKDLEIDEIMNQDSLIYVIPNDIKDRFIYKTQKSPNEHSILILSKPEYISRPCGDDNYFFTWDSQLPIFQIYNISVHNNQFRTEMLKKFYGETKKAYLVEKDYLFKSKKNQHITLEDLLFCKF